MTIKLQCEKVAPQICWPTPSATLVLVIMFTTLAVQSLSAQAKRYRVLYTFTGGIDGGNLVAGLVIGPTGNLYGTSLDGGDTDYGTVFKLTSSGTKTLLYSFIKGANGYLPYAPLVQDKAGNLYGTTLNGGSGNGTVFEVDRTGNYTVLHYFQGSPQDGRSPGALIMDAQGNLYGTTYYGGAYNEGIVFELSPGGGGSWTETVFYSFNGADGAHPNGGLVLDDSGNLYGTTSQKGARHHGTLFKLDATRTLTVLHNFGGLDGSQPIGSLIRDATGNMFGTSQHGGVAGYGNVFTVDSSGLVTVLYNFTGGRDGGTPYAGLFRDAAGNLYGTTHNGGDPSCGIPLYGCGVVFKLDTTGKYTVLHTFHGIPDGAYCWSNLVQDKAGNLYGTTASGGSSACGGYGCGTVFELTP